ncbi:DNA annealing helicase and endonuclease ZRANB3-like isoform X2 [Patiria miniata]|nr:DNA annealing helicase and endonuclease ZRANB3-like isoform X2 [Patiria miniata]
MGLGKTIQAISVAYFYRSEWPLLIVVPSSMRYPWIEELERWLPDLQPTDMNLISSGTDVRNIPKCKVSLVGYGLLRNDSQTLVKALTDQTFGVVIVDESHYMKNKKAARTKLLVPLLQAATRVILLTGTPALARPAELFTQIDSLQKGLVGSWSQFAKRYCNARWRHFGKQRTWDTSGASNLDELHKLLVQSVMIRRQKKQVLTQLPPKRRQKVPFELADSVEKKELEKCWTELDKVMNPQSAAAVEELSNRSFEVKKLATQMYNLTGKAKIGAVCEYIKMLLENQDLKFLVFAHHKEVLTALAQTVTAYAKEHKTQLKYIRIDGDVPSIERMHLVKQFQNDDDTKVALLSIMAAGTGLTLTAAAQVVFAELHWTPGVLEQCEDRAHRIGQHNAIHVHYLVARGTIDEWLWSALSRKVNVLSSTLNGRVQHLRMEEKGGEEVEFLKHAAAWLPSNRDLEDDDSFYFDNKKTSHDIRTFFTPSQSDSTKQRKRKRPSSSKPAETPPNPHKTETICIDDDDDDDFKVAKKHKPSCDRSPKELFSDDAQPVNTTVCPTPGAATRKSQKTTAKDEITASASSKDEVVVSHQFIDNLPEMKSNKKRQRRSKDKTENACSDSQSERLPDFDSKLEDPSASPQKSNQSKREHCTPSSSRKPQEENAVRNMDTPSPRNLPAQKFNTNESWSCCACTFENHAELPFCEICSTPRKTSRSRSSEPLRRDLCLEQGKVQDSSDGKERIPKSEQSSSTTPQTSASSVANSTGSSSVKVTKLEKHAACSNHPKPPSTVEKTSQTRETYTDDNNSLSSDSEATASYDLPREPHDISPSPTSSTHECSSEIEIPTKCPKPKKVTAKNQDHSKDLKATSDSAIMSEESTSEEHWTCDDPYCGYLNADYDTECEVCWSPRPKPKSDKSPRDSLSPGFIKASELIQSDTCKKANSASPAESLTFQDAEDLTADDSSQTESEQEPVVYDSFLYCPSKHTDRIYLYDQDGTALNCSFQAIDLQHRDLESLPKALCHEHNMRIALRFLREWNSLNEVKRKQLRKTGEVFDSPVAALEALKQGQHYQPCTKRYITKVDLAEAARQKAESLGGSLRVISKAKPTAKTAKRRLHHRPGDPGPSNQEQASSCQTSVKSPTTRHTGNKPREKAGHVSHATSTHTADTQAGLSSSTLKQIPRPCSDDNVASVERGTYVQAVDSEGRPLCVFCGKATASSTEAETHQSAAWDMRYCSEKCKDEHNLRWKNTKYIRQQLLEAERGVCQICGLEAQQLCNIIRDAAKSERKDLLERSTFSKMSTQRLNEIIRNPSSGQFWHADHIVAVHEGGGLCSLDNYRTLCVLCHDEVTAAQNRRRVNRNRAVGIPDIRSFFNS